MILLHSAVETLLEACAERVERRAGPSAQPRTKASGRGSATESVARYIEKVGAATVTADPVWQRLDDLRRLRNILVHRAGERGKSAEHQAAFDELVQKYAPELSSYDSPNKVYSHILVSLPFCGEMVREVSRFFARVLVQIGVAPEALPSQHRP